MTDVDESTAAPRLSPPAPAPPPATPTTEGLLDLAFVEDRSLAAAGARRPRLGMARGGDAPPGTRRGVALVAAWSGLWLVLWVRCARRRPGPRARGLPAQPRRPEAVGPGGLR
jgi:hypothetical protein